MFVYMYIYNYIHGSFQTPSTQILTLRPPEEASMWDVYTYGRNLAEKGSMIVTAEKRHKRINDTMFRLV